MVSQYPHTCTYGTPGTEDQWDDVNGGWIKGIPGEEKSVPCRAVASLQPRTFRGQDGTSVEYPFDLVFPASTERILDGAQVTVTDEDGATIASGLIRFQKGTLHCRGWI